MAAAGARDAYCKECAGGAGSGHCRGLRPRSLCATGAEQLLRSPGNHFAPALRTSHSLPHCFGLAHLQGLRQHSSPLTFLST